MEASNHNHRLKFLDAWHAASSLTGSVRSEGKKKCQPKPELSKIPDVSVPCGVSEENGIELGSQKK
jgi:hypothetical protein